MDAVRFGSAVGQLREIPVTREVCRVCVRIPADGQWDEVQMGEVAGVVVGCHCDFAFVLLSCAVGDGRAGRSQNEVGTLNSEDWMVICALESWVVYVH